MTEGQLVAALAGMHQDIAQTTARRIVAAMLADGLIAARWGKLRLTARGLKRLPAPPPAPTMRPYVPPRMPPRRPGSCTAHIPSNFAGKTIAWRHPC
ncbi:MAG TPA: hypothetical protein PK177_21585, partial [Burkholderiaceae bacterium]|nr:hypothetical protein [Burkholderiaceae bacterium]